MKTDTKTVTLILFCFFLNIQPQHVKCYFEFNINISSDDVRDTIDPFWRSTGFCPPKKHEDAASFDLSQDMELNLAYIGAIPSNGITQVRVHWLLDLVKVVSISACDGPQYDFSSLDAFVALLASNCLSPGFELMGNPSNIFTSMENTTQVYWWKDLISQTAQRYISQYGLLSVSRWNFETWNEPDCHDFDHLRMTVQGFLNYYDACSEGLKVTDMSLRLGGPADGCAYPEKNVSSQSSLYAEALLSHIIRGKNFFTGETGVRLDFLSFHEKGDGQGLRVLEKEIRLMDKLKSMFPEIVGKPFYNDEADPLVGWNKDREWRANAVYAALVAKIVAQHQNILLAQRNPPVPNYRLLSFDNGFLSYFPHQFTQRTLLARFQMNNTQSPYVTFVRKPVYAMMVLLTLLGEQQIHVDLRKNSELMANTSDYGALASLHEPVMGDNSSDSWQMTVLLYGASDPEQPSDYALVNLNWTISPPSQVKGLKLCLYVLYNYAYNPYDVWKDSFNKTSFPTLDQFRQIRQQEDPQPLLSDIPVPAHTGQVPIAPRFQLLDPHVAVLHLCAMPSVPPEQVTGLKFIKVTTGQVLLVWSDENIHTKCLLTYEVSQSTSGRMGQYQRINSQNSIITSFLYETDSASKVEGFYRVRAVDYWGRGGFFSQPVEYQPSPRIQP